VIICLQIDLLENPAIDDVVMLSIVLDEVKNRNTSVYNRVRTLCSNSLRRFFVFANEHHKYAPLLYHVIICNYLNAYTNVVTMAHIIFSLQ
jgi:hypothetical protein